MSSLSPAREHLLNNALDSMLSSEILDMMNCNVAKVVRAIDQNDIAILAQYINFPVIRGSVIDYTAARQQIYFLLMNNPVFRSKNPDIVCMSLAHYFSTHPTQQFHAPPSPSWAQRYLNAPAPINQMDGIPRPPDFDE